MFFVNHFLNRKQVKFKNIYKKQITLHNHDHCQKKSNRAYPFFRNMFSSTLFRESLYFIQVTIVYHKVSGAPVPGSGLLPK